MTPFEESEKFLTTSAFSACKTLSCSSLLATSSSNCVMLLLRERSFSGEFCSDEYTLLLGRRRFLHELDRLCGAEWHFCEPMRGLGARNVGSLT